MERLPLGGVLYLFQEPAHIRPHSTFDNRLNLFKERTSSIRTLYRLNGP